MLKKNLHLYQGELSSLMGSEGRSLSADVAAWNPFEDTPFNQLTEDHIFGAEFDKIRRGSNTSISGVKSRESLVMTYTELPEDPFESAPFSLPSKLSLRFLNRVYIHGKNFENLIFSGNFVLL